MAGIREGRAFFRNNSDRGEGVKSTIGASDVAKARELFSADGYVKNFLAALQMLRSCP